MIIENNNNGSNSIILEKQDHLYTVRHYFIGPEYNHWNQQQKVNHKSRSSDDSISKLVVPFITTNILFAAEAYQELVDKHFKKEAQEAS